MDPAERPSLLILRIWHEADGSLRAQIRIATHVTSGTASTINVADPQKALDIVEAFLEGRAVDPHAR